MLLSYYLFHLLMFFVYLGPNTNDKPSKQSPPGDAGLVAGAVVVVILLMIAITIAVVMIVILFLRHRKKCVKFPIFHFYSMLFYI